MRLTAVLILIAGLHCNAAIASDKKIWACRTEASDSRPILHLVEWGSMSYVKFANARLSARHETSSDSHGWYWSNEGGGYYRYGVVLEPDGSAWYHDFAETDESGLSAPLDRFSCEKIS